MLSQSCIYGIQTCIYLSLPQQLGKKVRVSSIAESLGISPTFLSKIVFTLVQGGVLCSTRGANGGVWLAKELSEIQTLDIIKVIDGPKLFKDCLLGFSSCNDKKPCPFHQQWGQERIRLMAMFQESTLDKIAQKVNDLDLRIQM